MKYDPDSLSASKIFCVEIGVLHGFIEVLKGSGLAVRFLGLLAVLCIKIARSHLETRA